MSGRSFFLIGCVVCAFLLALALLNNCSGKSAERQLAASTKPPGQAAGFTNYQELGDLEALKKRGIIRFTSFATPLGNQFPRSAIVTQSHNELADAFAKRLGLEAVWVDADSPRHAIELVHTGQADIIADNLTDTEARRDQLDFSKPLFQIEQKLVTGKKSSDIADPQKLHELRALKLFILEGTTHVDSAIRLIEEFPEIEITVREVPYNDDLDKLMDLVGEYSDGATILDSNEAEGMRQYRDDVHIGVNVSERENIAWGMRKDSPKLRLVLNNFITARVVRAEKPRISNWAQIKESKVLRLITANGPTYFYLWKGVLMGFDYDLAKAFAEQHDLELQVIVKPEDVELIQWLKEGRGDIAGASTTITEERKEKGVAFTTPYLEMAEQIVSNKKKPTINSLEDLNGRTLTLRAFSSFIESAKVLRRSGIDVKVEVAEPEVSYQQIVNMIADGQLDATILDAHAAQIESSLRPDLQTGMIISDPRPQGWMVLPQNTELLKQLNKFISQYRKSKSYQNKLDAYFKPNGR
jgi:membrane-bound lytic murein transglycosylase F